jgi:glycosyltransferase involved in cell wall biosynthesis
VIGVHAAASLTSANTVFVLIAFEGPDRYSQAGGLGVRVSELATTLASSGFETHLFFVGDPNLPAEEEREHGRLVLHRWGQWISAFHPGGVYDGEADKIEDLNASLSPYVVDRILRPAARAGRVAVVLSEDWQTAECAVALSDQCHAAGIRDRVVLFWNANDLHGFDQVDWQRLAFTNAVTAVSSHVRSILRARGVDALVIPDGIPERLLLRTSDATSRHLRSAFRGSRLLFKMARWDREKGWTQALDAVALLRARRQPTTLVARTGGPNGLGGDLYTEARARGLFCVEVQTAADVRSRIAAIGQRRPDVVSLRFGVDESLAHAFYAAADAVLANSVSEPFGLVGLEAMAAGAVVVTGGTGEDYAVSGRNAVVLETLDPEEIARRSDELAASPATAARLRRAARATASRYTWGEVTRTLIARVADQAARQRPKSDHDNCGTPNDGRIRARSPPWKAAGRALTSKSVARGPRSRRSLADLRRSAGMERIPAGRVTRREALVQCLVHGAGIGEFTVAYGSWQEWQTGRHNRSASYAAADTART